MNLKKYLEERGGGLQLARAVGVSAVIVSQWKTGARQVPAERCPAIERATDGAVTCEELRPDVDWAYLRGTRCGQKKVADPHAANVPAAERSGSDGALRQSDQGAGITALVEPHQEAA
jgi:DNA-binding transcriptional regulator YdaS (Cro superfamily)